MRLYPACGDGIFRLVVDAGVALTSRMIAVPIAFIVGEAAAIGQAMRDYEHEYGPPTTNSPEPGTHDLGTIVTIRCSARLPVDDPHWSP